MDLSEEELNQVAQYAELLFTPEEVAVIMGLPADRIKLQMQIDGSAFKNAYLRARLTSEARLRKSVIDLATKGSSPAQILASQMMQQLILREVTI